LYVRNSGNTTLRDVNLLGNNYNFVITGGTSITHWIQDIDTSNLVDGRPMYYWVDQHNRQVPSDAGYVTIVGSSNITVRDLNLTKVGTGVLMLYTNHSLVENVRTYGNYYTGVSLYRSNHNIVRNNVISSNGWRGIIFWHSLAHNNLIHNNKIIDNGWAPGAWGNGGIDFQGAASNNTIYHNNIINNKIQASTDGHMNVWDNGHEGNYWSDYAGIDSDNNGIGDTPYIIDAHNQDNYPLMEPWPLLVDATLPTIKVEPKNYTACHIGQVFNINITINDLSVNWEMSSVEILLKYNSSILEVLDVADGPLMRNVAEHYSELTDEFPGDNPYVFLWGTEPDFVWIVIVIYHPPVWMRVYPEGNGTLATITFRATAGPKDQCPLELQVLSLLDEGLNGIPYYTEDGFYRILVGDLNIDSKVDMQDVGIAARAFGSYPGHPRWDPEADVNSDNKINLRDIAIVARNFGKTYP
jgi:parallel beta-helix repeat protein